MEEDFIGKRVQTVILKKEEKVFFLTLYEPLCVG